jgi:hypothetical protein
MSVCRSVLVLLAGLIGCTAREPNKRVSPLQFGAYYYPWYFPQRWIKEPVTDTPRLGQYSSSDQVAARRHVQWAKQAGLDFFMISWLGPQGREDQNFRHAVLPEIEDQGFHFAFLYDTALALDLSAGKPLDFDQKLKDGKRAGERFLSHFDYLADAYLKHKNQLTFKGKVVVNLYLVRDMVHAAPYLKQLRDRLQNRGIALFLIADVVYWAQPGSLDWTFLKENFQAITAYNMYYRPLFLDRVRSQFQACDRMAREHGLVFIPNVMPGYDDTPLRGRDRATLDRQDGVFYRSYWEMAAAFVKADQPFLLITSFNEWHEGTEIEPSLEYGDFYVTLTSQLIAGKRAESGLQQ